jgi:antibiotic biosynthesis monooxygenase (ABM) superfamily enzyme
MSGNAREGDPASSGLESVTIITQTRVRHEAASAFARWQDETSTVVAAFPGFIKQTVVPPSPPQQVDWLILQRFASSETAIAWLNSAERLRRVEEAASMLAGGDDIHLVKDGGAGALPAPVSAVISTRIKPGQEAAYRQWELSIAAAQSRAAGFQGYRLEPPIPGVQDDWLAILRFDTEANLQAWLDSPERQTLLQGASKFTEEFHTRIARTGFDQWFAIAPGQKSPSAPWKQNMLVLLLLYPVVFLFGAWVQTPWLMEQARMPFWLALFVGNVASILVLNWLVPWVSNRFEWWLHPVASRSGKTDLTGAAIVVALYVLCLLVFSLHP